MRLLRDPVEGRCGAIFARLLGVRPGTALGGGSRGARTPLRSPLCRRYTLSPQRLDLGGARPVDARCQGTTRQARRLTPAPSAPVWVAVIASAVATNVCDVLPGRSRHNRHEDMNCACSPGDPPCRRGRWLPSGVLDLRSDSTTVDAVSVLSCRRFVDRDPGLWHHRSGSVISRPVRPGRRVQHPPSR